MDIQINTITLEETIINTLSLTTQMIQIVPTIKNHTGEEKSIPLILNKEVDQEAVMTLHNKIILKQICLMSTLVTMLIITTTFFTK